MVSIMVGKVKMWGLAIATIFGYMNYFNICSEIIAIIPAIIVIVMQIIVIFGYGDKIRKIKNIRKEKVKFKRGKELKVALFDTNYYLDTIDISLLDKLTIK